MMACRLGPFGRSPEDAEPDRAMRADANPVEAAIIDVMATWGAAALPGAAELFEALSAAAAADGREPLRRLLEMEGDALEPELRDEIAAACDPAAETATPSRIDDLTLRAEEALRQVTERRRASLEAELRAWAGLLASADRESIWQRLWEAERGEGLGEHLARQSALRQAVELLDRSRQGIRAELDELLRTPQNADPGVLEAARQALEADDPRRIAVSRARLRDLSANARRAELEARIADGRTRLSELVDNVRRALADSASVRHAASHAFVEPALARAEALLSSTAEAAAEDAETLLPALESWGRTLAVALDGVRGADSAGDGRPAQAWADGLAREIEATSGARDLAEELGRASGEGPLALHAAATRALDWIESARGREASAAEQAGERLRPLANALGEQLERSASALPTEKVVDTRLLLDRADEALAGGKADEIDSLVETVQALAAELERLAAGYREQRSSRDAAQRRRVAGEANSWLRLADKRNAGRIEALAKEIERAGPAELPRLRERVEAAGARIGNAIRLDAARTLRRAEAVVRRAGDRSGAEDLRAGTDRLRAALESDDLPVLVEATRATREGLKGTARPGWPLRVAVIGILAAALGGGGYWVWQMQSAGSTGYELRLASGADTPADAKLTLVLDGEVVREASFDANGAVQLELPGGRYEIYVNGAFTGRVLDVPDDPTVITDIPFPR